MLFQVNQLFPLKAVVALKYLVIVVINGGL